MSKPEDDLSDAQGLDTELRAPALESELEVSTSEAESESVSDSELTDLGGRDLELGLRGRSL